MASRPLADNHRVAALVEDSWINSQASYVPGNLGAPTRLKDRRTNRPVHRTHGLDAITDCSIAICATYYLHLFLDNPPYHEPLLPALGGLTGIEAHLTQDLAKFKEHDVLPLFIFDGQNMAGQAETTVKKMRLANRKTDEAWEQYFASRAEDAVASFGANGGMRSRALRSVRWTGADEAVTQGRSVSRACILC